MADQADISQLIIEAAQDASGNQLSQLIAEVAQTGSLAQLSQLIAEIAQTASGVQISQLTIELARGPEVAPPADTPVGTFTFDEGLGNDYFMLLQLSDYGDEMRDHVVKSFRLTGKVTNLRAQIYGTGALEDINVDEMVAGVNSRTGVIALPNTAQVQRSRRFPVNVKNISASTIRIDGNWGGDGIRDRIDEIVIEAAQQGVRR